MKRWMPALILLGGGLVIIASADDLSYALRHSTGRAPPAIYWIIGIVACVIGLRFAVRELVRSARETPAAAGGRPATDALADAQVMPDLPAKAPNSTASPAPLPPEARAVQINAFFSDPTNTLSFDVPAMLTALGVTRGDLYPYATNYTGTTEGGFTTDWRTLARQVAHDIPVVTAQRTVVSEMPNFKVQRTVFRMSEQEKEIFRIMALLNAFGAIDPTFYRNFEWGMIFGGGSATFTPIGQPTGYTEVAKAAMADFLAAQLSAPNELIDGALGVMHQIKKQYASPAPQPATPEQAPPTRQQIEAVQKVLDDL